MKERTIADAHGSDAAQLLRHHCRRKGATDSADADH
jgi:hypothetical protein